MRTHSEIFKREIPLFGRQFDSIITYGNTTLTNEQINSITPIIEGGILKSCMKELQIDANSNIHKDTKINVQFGIYDYDNDQYEYINLGDYYVIESEKQEDTHSYLITCYDKMIFTMKDYEEVALTYPTTIKEYITGLCDKVGITFANRNSDFANYDKEMPSDLYKGLGYTYRDVLDELAQVTASTICINENDELEIRYIQSVGNFETITGIPLHIDNADDSKITLSLKGDTQQDTAILPSEYQQVEYIQSSGTQYIETNVNLSDNSFKISTKMSVTEFEQQEQAIMSIWLSNYSYWNCFITTSKKISLYLGGHNIIDKVLELNKQYNLEVERINNSDWKVSLDNDTVNANYSPSSTNETTLKLFTRGDVPATSYSNTHIKMRFF